MKLLEVAARVAGGGAQERNFRLGCVAKRKDGAIVTSTNEKTRKPHPAAHAEARVLRKAGGGATLWVARIMKDGTWAMAKPCKTCHSRIISADVIKVYYTIGPNEWGIWYPQRNESRTRIRR